MDKKRIIYEDDKMIIYNKPSGVLVQSNKSFDVDLMSDIKTYLVRKGERADLFVINRLDRPVSGLVLMAKNKDMAAKLSKILQNKNIDKEYFAVVLGELSSEQGVFEDYIVTDTKNNISKVTGPEDTNAKKSNLEYKVIACKETEKGTLSLVKIKLLTGRHHQIRVQFASRGWPLLGDTKYGNKESNSDNANQNVFRSTDRSISLCSYRLEFEGKAYSIIPSGNGFEYFKDDLDKLS